MARPDPDGLIELCGEIFIGQTTASRSDNTTARSKAHAHKHRRKRAANVQAMTDFNGRCCVMCGQSIPMERQANAVFCSLRGPCARKADNLRRRTRKRIERSAAEIQQMYQRLSRGTLVGAARVSAMTTIMMWIHQNGPNIASPRLDL